MEYIPTDLLNMGVISTTAATQYRKMGGQFSQVAQFTAASRRIAVIQGFRFLQFGVAEAGGVAPQTFHALQSVAARFEQMREVARVGTVDHIVHGSRSRQIARFINMSSKGLATRERLLNIAECQRCYSAIKKRMRCFSVICLSGRNSLRMIHCNRYWCL